MIKTIKHFTISSLLYGLLFTSCDLDRLPMEGPSTGNFPANEQEAILGLNGAYQSISTLDAASTPIWHVMDNITDVGYARPGNNYTSPITSSVTTDNALATKPWQYHYRTIARVHLVLDNLSNLETSMDEGSYLQLAAELRFVRAYCYSQLIELYGNVPLLRHAVGLDNADVPRTPKAEIQQFILDEMSEIAEHLPINQSAYGHVRASRIAAYMLKARVALYAKRYAVAAEAAKKGLEYAEGIHDLTSFNATIDVAGKDHRAGEPDVSNIFGHEGYANSAEWIWVAEYSIAAGNTHNRQYYGASRLGKGVCYWGPTQNFIDSFQALDGLPIDESPLYDAQRPFENRDPRLDLYCVRPASRFMGYQFQPQTEHRTVFNYWPVNNGSSSEPSSVTNTDATNAYRSFSGYLWRKHLDLNDFNSTSVSGESELNVGIFRLAELFLIYAEAKIEANELDGSVYSAINKIRQRAHMPPLTEGLTQQQLRSALRYERKIELANDGLRWYDLRRWGIATDVMNGYLYLNRAGNGWSTNTLQYIDENHNPVYNHNEATKHFTTQTVIYKENKDEYWPIPASEMDANKQLIQNPGY
ncbi:RagB/SusD family nutrient uptake outer membrane protein [Sphingobacterium gobiense]|uniref:RagB/SusD family nutrient uptake outer membrane protein n=1 Tax=Sphingobacterium gobiense TaxID=1382456 RepID=A0A2S9JS38_9SPHI|nr:RagB/SusD family nutrient uptake outer membrane protein [Sphingobacterium gobiense]PRD56102.1 RagB/SusD family nutrient uptake outer membrane protein [Sphingobacterium gobiense]